MKSLKSVVVAMLLAASMVTPAQARGSSGAAAVLGFVAGAVVSDSLRPHYYSTYNPVYVQPTYVVPQTVYVQPAPPVYVAPAQPV